MAEKLAVVYTARNKQQAHMLRNLLEEAGIEAVVSGDVLSDGTGVDAVGWATAARVVVAEEDAAKAREMAEQFDRQGALAAGAGQPDGAESGATELAPWPTCPECGARRTTSCPVCQSSGTDFPQADPNFVGSLEPDEGAKPMSCACGSGGCSSHGPKTDEASAEGDAAQGERPPSLVLTCTMCDEPFEPEFLRHCEWCGHEFPDGFEMEEPQGPPPEEVAPRVLAVMVGLGLLAIGLIAYFMFLVPAG